VSDSLGPSVHTNHQRRERNSGRKPIPGMVVEQAC